SKGKQDLIDRMKLAGKDVRTRQKFTVEDGGAFHSVQVAFDPQKSAYVEEFPLKVNEIERAYRVEVRKPENFKKEEIHVYLRITTPERSGADGVKRSQTTTAIDFDVGNFDFPMVRNTRLSQDQRCAVVMD